MIVLYIYENRSVPGGTSDSSSNYNPLGYSIWSIWEKSVNLTSHQSLELLKSKLRKDWDAIPQELFSAVCL